MIMAEYTGTTESIDQVASPSPSLLQALAMVAAEEAAVAAESKVVVAEDVVVSSEETVKWVDLGTDVDWAQKNG